jgi:DNA-binding transcriptional regulator YdaS (Cro superfamily)
MELHKYLSDTKANRAEFARAIGVSDALLYQWVNNLRPVAPRHCPAIEEKTNGQVTRKDLRPDDWQSIWPELNQ